MCIHIYIYINISLMAAGSNQNLVIGKAISTEFYNFHASIQRQIIGICHQLGKINKRRHDFVTIEIVCVCFLTFSLLITTKSCK